MNSSSPYLINRGSFLFTVGQESNACLKCPASTWQHVRTAFLQYLASLFMLGQMSESDRFCIFSQPQFQIVEDFLPAVSSGSVKTIGCQVDIEKRLPGYRPPVFYFRHRWRYLCPGKEMKGMCPGSFLAVSLESTASCSILKTRRN